MAVASLSSPPIVHSGRLIVCRFITHSTRCTHHPVAPDHRYDADLAFLGNRLPDREARVEQFLLRPAEQLPMQRFLLGGSGWDDKPCPPNISKIGHVGTEAHNAFNVTPRAVLNINRASMAAVGFSPPTRLFEAAGAGACLITDAWDGIELFLAPGTEVLVAHDGSDIVEILRSLSAAKAAEIGDAARRRILAEHTYDRRAATLHRVLTDALAGKRAMLAA